MKNDLLHGNPIKSVVLFALPIMASSVLQYNYNLVDNIIVGRFVGADALAAVGNVSSINSFIIGTSLGLTSGFTIIVAQSFGARKYDKMNKYAGNSITLSLIIGVIIAVAAHILSMPLLKLIDTPDEIIDMSADYVNILYYTVPVQMSLNNFNALSRAVGDSKRPLYFLIVSVFINLGLDLLLVGVFGMGVTGAAWATATSQIIAAVLSAASVFRLPEYNISGKCLKPDFKISLSQIKLGIPISLQFTITSIGTMVLQTTINSFGANVIAGLTAASRVEQLTNIPMSGFGVGNMTFVSQNYGAGNYERIIKNVKRIFLLDIIASVLCSLLLVTVGPLIVRLFTEDYNADMMIAANQYLKSIASCYCFVAALFVLRNTLQGLGFTYSNMIAGAGELAGRLIISLAVTPVFGFKALCFAAPAAWLLADIPLVFIYLSKKKKFKSLIESRNQSIKHI